MSNLLQSEKMNCMEVCGGNQTTERAFAMPGLAVWVWSRPQGQAATAGGDVHYLSSCASGRITRMLMADVCAGGKLYVDVTTRLRDLMMKHVNHVRQSRFVREMSSHFSEIPSQGGCATAMISTYFAPTRSFSICNAGHPSPLVFRAAKQEWSLLRNKRPSKAETAGLDGAIGTDEYQQLDTRLALGDMVLSYSHAFTELRDIRGKIWTEHGLLDHVRHFNDPDPSDLFDDLTGTLEKSQAEGSCEEDASLLICKAVDTKTTLRDNLMAPLRLLGSAVDRTVH